MTGLVDRTTLNLSIKGRKDESKALSKKCLEDVTLRSAIENDQGQANRLGINATPGFLFGRMQGGRMSVQRVGNGFVDYSTLSKQLDSMLSSSFPLSR